MRKKTSQFLQVGKMGIPLVVILMAAGLIFLLWVKPNSEWSEQGTVVSNPYCALDNDPNPPTFEGFAYTMIGRDCGESTCFFTTIKDGDGQEEMVKYKRIKSNVPIWDADFTGEECRGLKKLGETDPEKRREWERRDDADECKSVTPEDPRHFVQSNKLPFVTPTDPKDPAVRKEYTLWYPQTLEGRSYYYGSGNRNIINYDKYHLVFLEHRPEAGFVVPGKVSYGQYGDKDDPYFRVVDLYQWEGAEPITDPKILDCVPPVNLTTTPGTTPKVTIVQSTQSKSPDQKQLQLEYFLFDKPGASRSLVSWWTPQCKPAIYLYPEEKTEVHVQVKPKGYLTYTDPKYPTDGWKVISYPDGTISSNNKEYQYLYYESKIRDEYIQKPEKGYVVSFYKLKTTFDELLPKLGLNSKETHEFKEYWLKALPFSPYYFIGVMDEKNIDEIEPLTISPKPDSLVRVRLYFEAQSSWKKVEAPTFSTAERQGFTVVEWGGMVKLYEGEFTCSQ